jgi:hypothetical protein
MNPKIYKSKAAKQAEYREAKKLGMTCAEFRAHIAAGGKPAPETEGNKGWDMLHAARARKADMEGSTTACHSCGYKKCQCAGIDKYYAENPRVTPPVPRRKTHNPSTSGKHVAGVTACGKFEDEVLMASDPTKATCGKCRTKSTVTQLEDRLDVLLKHFGIEEYRKPEYDRLTPEEKTEVDADVACSEDSE